MANFEAMALKYLTEGAMDMIPELRTDYFTERYNKLYTLVLEYFDANKKLPTATELKAIVEARAPASVKAQFIATVEMLDRIDLTNTSTDVIINELRELKILREVDNQMQALVEAQRDKDTAKVKQLLNKLNEKINLKGIKVTDLDTVKDMEDTHTICRSFLPKEQEQEILGGGFTALTVLSADTGAGKSVALQGTAVNNFLDGKNVLYISLELDKKVVYNRMLSQLASVEFTKINGKTLNDEEKKRCEQAHKEFFHKRDNYLRIIDDPMTDKELISLISVYAQLHKVDVIIIDYLQLVSSESSGEDWRMLSNLSKKLHQLTRLHSVNIVTAAQIKSEGKKKGSIIPIINARGSSEIKFSSSQFIHFERDFDADHVVMFTIKNRIHKPTHLVLKDMFQFMRFESTDIILEE